MAKRISRSGPIDQIDGVFVYTVPALASATVGGIGVNIGYADATITVSNFVDATGVTTSYTVDLKAGDSFSDDFLYVLAPADYIKIESTKPATYRAYVDLP